MQKNKIIKPKELAEQLSISIATLYRWHANGTIPIEKIQVGPRSVGYRQSDVNAWINGDLDQNEAEIQTEEQGSN